MQKMGFKAFNWPHNPEELKVEHTRKPLYGKDAQGGPVYLGMGALNCTVTGTGMFTGELALETVADLEAVFRESTSGILRLPQGDLVHAYFTELVLEQDARPQYVRYHFVFRGADKNGGIPA